MAPRARAPGKSSRIDRAFVLVRELDEASFARALGSASCSGGVVAINRVDGFPPAFLAGLPRALGVKVGAFSLSACLFDPEAPDAPAAMPEPDLVTADFCAWELPLRLITAVASVRAAERADLLRSWARVRVNPWARGTRDLARPKPPLDEVFTALSSLCKRRGRVFIVEAS